MAADHGSCEEVRAGEITVTFGFMQIRERTIGDGFVDPGGHGLQDLAADIAAGDGHGEEFPVCLGVEVAAVQGETVLLAHIVVPEGLPLIDMPRDEAYLVLAWRVTEGLLSLVALRREAGAVEMEAKLRIGI